METLTGENIKPTRMQSSKNGTTIQNIVEQISNEDETVRVAENPDLKKFYSSILDQHKEYPDPVPILSIKQNDATLPFLTLQSFSLWQGKQKSKKTTFLAMVVAAFLCGRIGDSTNIYSLGEGVVIVFDTEQGESYAARTMRLILKLAGLDASMRIIYCNLREYTPGERMKIIKAGVENTKDIRLVVIDGLVDLVNDFMEAAEAHRVITELLSMCSQFNIHIAGVLHQNKADKNARAHIGTIASQKCEMEIMTEVDAQDKSLSVVTCANSRGVPFEPFTIRWEKGSLPCIVSENNNQQKNDTKTARNYEQSKEVAETVFKPFLALSHTDAINGIMRASLKSESTAKRLMKDFEGWGLIEKGFDGKYRIKINEGSRVHEGSNTGS